MKAETLIDDNDQKSFSSVVDEDDDDGGDICVNKTRHVRKIHRLYRYYFDLLFYCANSISDLLPRNP